MAKGSRKRKRDKDSDKPRGMDLDDEEETLAFIRDYFQLDTDLLELYDSWSTSDPVFASLRERFQGIRMLRQDPWECLISCVSLTLFNSLMKELMRWVMTELVCAC